MIPETYEQWQHCITVECGIPLTAAYCEQRLASLGDKNEYRTRQFIELYGSAHFERVIAWFQKALQQLR